MARAGVWGHEQNCTAKIRKPPTPQPGLCSLEEEPNGGLPAPLSEVAGRQGKVERHVVEDLGELAPLVQILDLPVPQMVDNVLDALWIPERPMAVQVIEVPKILIDVILARSLVPEPQTAEQLVEVPTVLSPTRIALQIAEQVVDTPVPQGRGGQRRVQGSLPGQSTTAAHSSGQHISERIVEQIVDISLGGGLGQGSASSAGAADENFTGFFRTFPRGKKVRVPPRVRVRSYPGRSAHGHRRLVARPTVPTSGCSSPGGANPSTGTDAPTRPYGPHLRASRLSGSASSLQQGGFGTGTRKRV